MIHHTHCPVCKSSSIHAALTVKDYTVSGKTFSIWHCDTCTARFTQDIPSQDEIGAYYASEDYISHSDTKKGMVNRLYHLVRKMTLSSKLKMVNHETGRSSGHVLDVGCGTGAFLNTMQQAGWKVTGLEPDPVASAKALSLYNIKTHPLQSLFVLPQKSFHAITLWHVLEHVHQLHEYVSTFKQLLALGGKLFIAVPNYTSADAGRYRESWAAYDVPRHLYHFSPVSMRSLMEMHGLKVEKIEPMWFDAFYVSMLSEKYRYGKSNLPMAFLNGMKSNSKTLAVRERCSSLIYIVSGS